MWIVQSKKEVNWGSHQGVHGFSDITITILQRYIGQAVLGLGNWELFESFYVNLADITRHFSSNPKDLEEAFPNALDIFLVSLVSSFKESCMGHLIYEIQ